jgi:hypothetical protein
MGRMRFRALRFSRLTTRNQWRRGTLASGAIVSDVPIVMQHTRLDSR